MNYEKVSDFEINKAVAEIVYGKYNVEDDSIKKCDGMYCYDVDTSRWVHFAPCSDPADAWPVIIDNKISMVYDDSEHNWQVGCDFVDLSGCEGGGFDFLGAAVYESDNPLRAAMVVFLMMQEHKELDK